MTKLVILLSIMSVLIACGESANSSESEKSGCVVRNDTLAWIYMEPLDSVAGRREIRDPMAFFKPITAVHEVCEEGGDILTQIYGK